jgi:hypothetical protein
MHDSLVQAKATVVKKVATPPPPAPPAPAKCRALKNDVCQSTDVVKLDIPTYYKVIKKPMDMSTMRKKLDAGEYPNATKFFEDFKLMIRNCFIFNSFEYACQSSWDPLAAIVRREMEAFATPSGRQ